MENTSKYMETIDFTPEKIQQVSENAKDLFYRLADRVDLNTPDGFEMFMNTLCATLVLFRRNCVKPEKWDRFNKMVQQTLECFE
jgi:hypothetical protein